MKKMNVTENDIDKLYIAGAFGNYIDPENARTIGIYPEISIEKIHFVGNTAGTGARMCLASKEMRERAEEISKRVKYFELAADPEFQSEYINSTYLPHVNLNKYPITVFINPNINFYFFCYTFWNAEVYSIDNNI